MRVPILVAIVAGCAMSSIGRMQEIQTPASPNAQETALPQETAASPQQETPPSPEIQRPMISVHSDLVVLRVSVENSKSGFVPGLAQEAFTVYEDDQPQAITFFNNEDTPVTVGLVIDNSGSMQRKRERVIASGLAFARSSHPQDETFLVNFNEHVSLGLPRDTMFTNELPELHTALAKIGAIGQTALFDAVAVGLDHLKGGSHDRRILIVVSDGADNASRRTRDELLEKVKQSNAVIYTVGVFDEYDDADRGSLKKLAEFSGGESYFPRTTDKVVEVLEQIAQDVRNGYTIGYEPSNPARDGRYRKIRVTAQSAGRGKLSVRARDGYTAPSDESAQTER